MTTTSTTLILTIGISGSGKSTYVKSHFPPEIIVSTDAIRKEITGDINNQASNKKIFEIATQRIKVLLKKTDAVLDATNVDLFALDGLISSIQPGKIRFLVFRSDPHVCHARIREDLQQQRERAVVPEDVVKRQYEKMQRLLPYLKEYSSDIEWIEEG